MKIHPRYAAVGAGVLALATLAACGSDNTSSSSTGGTASSSSSSTGGSTSSSSSTGGAGINCSNGNLTGQGSTAQNTAISQFIKDYQSACGSSVNINYTANGSGPGITAFTSKQADWAGSDFALNDQQQTAADARCGTGKAVSVGTIPGAIAVMYNVPGVDKLNLSAKTLGGIFDNKITSWDDAAIKAENPGVNLPTLKIQAFHRSDGSGTSYNFSNYLNKVAPDAFAHAANKAWPGTGGQGVQGSKGVTQGVQSTSGGIGYAEISYATQANLKTAAIGNAQGQFVPLTIDNANKFIGQSKIDSSNGNYKFTFDYTYSDPAAYPAVLVTYEIVCSQGNDSAKLPLLKNFLGYLSSSSAQAKLPGIGYVSLSSDQASKVQAIFAGLS